MRILTRPLLFSFAFILLVLSACRPAITPEKLYGTWKYTKLEHPGANPPSAEPDWKLKIENPSIVFTKNNQLTIWWDGKVLTHGTFKVDGNNIRYKEVLPDGNTREFPFYVTRLTDTEIVFETLGAEGSRVTAAKH
jgi:hypothetical protein